MKSIILQLVFLSTLLFGQQYSVSLTQNIKGTFILDNAKSLGSRPTEYNSQNYFFTDSLEIDDYYELHFDEEFNFISVIQTKSGKFFLDKNINRILDDDEIIDFSEDGYLEYAKVELDLGSQYLSTFILRKIPGTKLLIVQNNPAFYGEIPIDNSKYKVVLIVPPNVLSISNKKILEIGIDFNNDKRISSNEMTVFDGLIKVNEHTLTPFDIKFGTKKIELLFKESSEEVFLGLGFMHPSLEILNVSNLHRMNILDFEGKYIVINWWGIHCGPCLLEIPELNNLKEEFKDNHFVDFIALTTDNTLEVEKFLANKKYTFKQFSVDRIDARNLGINAIPRTIVLDENGKIIFDQEGYNQQKGLKDLKALMNGIL